MHHKALWWAVLAVAIALIVIPLAMGGQPWQAAGAFALGRNEFSSITMSAGSVHFSPTVRGRIAKQFG